jgi:predicted small lipoprotein YifL
VQIQTFENNMRAIFLPVLLVVLLAGCGRKGPLYLPTPEQKAAAENAAVRQLADAEKK